MINKRTTTYNNLLCFVYLFLFWQHEPRRERESPSQCALCHTNCMKSSMQIHPSGTDKRALHANFLSTVFTKQNADDGNFLHKWIQVHPYVYARAWDAFFPPADCTLVHAFTRVLHNTANRQRYLRITHTHTHTRRLSKYMAKVLILWF